MGHSSKHIGLDCPKRRFAGGQLGSLNGRTPPPHQARATTVANACTAALWRPEITTPLPPFAKASRRAADAGQRAGNQDNGGAHIASPLYGADMPGLRARTKTVYHRSGAGVPRIYADVGDLGFPGGFGKYFVRGQGHTWEAWHEIWSCGICVISWPSPKREV
jgi:hypothetical protein